MSEARLTALNASSRIAHIFLKAICVNTAELNRYQFFAVPLAAGSNLSPRPAQITQASQGGWAQSSINASETLVERLPGPI